MARSRSRSRSRSGSRDNRGSVVETVQPKLQRTPTPAQIRRTANNLPPEAVQTQKRQATYRASMAREVAGDLRGIIKTPNFAQPSFQQPDPVRVAGVKAPEPRKVSSVEPRAINRKPKVIRSTKVEPALDNDTVRPTCKPRPKDNKGNGSSRAFVPWCGKS